MEKNKNLKYLPVIILILLVAACLPSLTAKNRKTIIMNVPNVPSTIKTNARTVKGALKDAGIVYHENITKVNGHVYIRSVKKIRVKGKIITPQSKDYEFELLLNNNNVRLNTPIKDYDTISIVERRIKFE